MDSFLKLAFYAGTLAGVVTLGVGVGTMAEPIGLSNAEPAAEHPAMSDAEGVMPGALCTNAFTVDTKEANR